jgi:voltage-gated potassium channel
MIPVIFRFFNKRVLKDPPPALRMSVLLFAVLVYGASGFLYFELAENPSLGWTDAFWYSFVTITTVGYGDFFPKTSGGRFLVAVPLMGFGIGLLGYALSLAASALVQARSKELQGMGNLDMEDHLVVFNYPNLAKVERLLDEIRADPSFNQPRVILVDEDLEQLPPELVERGVRYVRGSPIRDETLARACVARAAYAVVLSKRPGDPRSDDLSLAIALSVETHAERVHTVVECQDPSAEELIKKSGSDRVVCTARFDAHFLSNELMNPGVQEVVELLTTNLKGDQIYITSIESKGKHTFGTLTAKVRGEGHIAIGVRQAKKIQLNVSPELALRAGDELVTIGPRRLAPM